MARYLGAYNPGVPLGFAMVADFEGACEHVVPDDVLIILAKPISILDSTIFGKPTFGTLVRLSIFFAWVGDPKNSPTTGTPE